MPASLKNSKPVPGTSLPLPAVFLAALLLAALARPGLAHAGDSAFAGFYIGSDFDYRVVGYNPEPGLEYRVEPDADTGDLGDPRGERIFPNFFSDKNRFSFSGFAGYRVTLQDAFNGGLLGYPGDQLYLGGEINAMGGFSGAQVDVFHNNLEVPVDGTPYDVTERREYESQYGLEIALDVGAAIWHPDLLAFLRLAYAYSYINTTDSILILTDTGGNPGPIGRRLTTDIIQRVIDQRQAPVRGGSSSALALGVGVEYRLNSRLAVRAYYMHGFGNTRVFDSLRVGAIFYF